MAEMIGLGSAGFCKLAGIKAVFRQQRGRWPFREHTLEVCYCEDSLDCDSYEFLYRDMAERDAAYVRLCAEFQFAGREPVNGGGN